MEWAVERLNLRSHPTSKDFAQPGDSKELETKEIHSVLCVCQKFSAKGFLSFTTNHSVILKS